MDKNEIIGLIYEWQGLILKRGGVERIIEPRVFADIESKPIKIITGFRRTGKSFLTQRLAQRLVREGKYKLENILYLNLEDYRLSEINTAKKLADIYRFFTADIAQEGKKIIFIDEVQKVFGWDKFVRTIYEKEDDLKIVLTGSNSELLSAELGTNLAGRFIEFFIYPFSFGEFLLYRKINVRDEKDFLKNKNEIDKLFSEYANYGGLPEIFEVFTEDAKFSYLKGIITKVVLDDIVKRFGVDNVDVLERLLNYVLSNTGSIVSYTNLRNKIKSMGFDVKIETVMKYIGYFVKAFAVLDLDKFDWKQRKIFSSSKKYYAMDGGMVSLYRPSRENYPQRLENFVFLHLKGQKNKIYYGANERGREIDFLVDRGPDGFDKYQICLSLEEHNKKRELGVFSLADKYLQKGNNFLLTLRENQRAEKSGSHEIKVMNIIRWLLDI